MNKYRYELNKKYVVFNLLIMLFNCQMLFYTFSFQPDHPLEI